MPDKILMVSGGKDSSVLIEYCLKNSIHIDRYVFGDTCLELPCVYEWLDYLENRFKIRIERIQSNKKFEDLFYKVISKGPYKGEIRGFPMVVSPCWISRDVKFRGTKLDGQLKDCVRVIGYCADEKRKLTEFAYVAPFVDAGITEKQVIKYAKENGLYPPIYTLLEKYRVKKTRSGCWLCPKCSLGWSRMIYYEYPDLWKKLRELDAVSPHGWKTEPFDVIEKRIKHFGRPSEQKFGFEGD
jgi:3'-phosphoadenosine 5'-phosphosulfate sulfotransferase (PAPS reductase)/FAD synthetase